MRIQGFSAWNAQPQVTSDPHQSAWAGIAIGPGSDEGLVLIDGVPLQAGRVHPVRQSRYTVKHVRPIGEQSGDQSLDCIKGLNLILFEHAAELGCEIARPNQSYSVRDFVSSEETLALSVPFVGRRQALFMLTSPDLGVASFGYKIKGVRWQYSSRSVQRYTGPVDATANLDENGSLALYVGGEDNAEEWDALELYLDTDGSTFNVDVDTIGEIGAR